MMLSFQSSSWADIDALRQRIMGAAAESVEESAQTFADELANRYSTVVLARVFLVLPFASLLAGDRVAATALANEDSGLTAKTPVLTLLGTAGREPEWKNRKRSAGHRAIPLLSSAHVQGIPMLAKLLADLEVNLAGLDDGKPIATRRMLGGRNCAFFVPDALTSQDDAGRHIIPARDFVQNNGIRTVFGMGGAYADGTLAAAVVFTSEAIDRAIVDRFPSVISNFKMATATLLSACHIYRDADARD